MIPTRPPGIFLNAVTTRRTGTAAGLLAVALWCWSGPALAGGSRALGPLPFLTLATLIGVVTGTVFHLVRGGSLAQLVRLPARVAVASFIGVAVYTLLLTFAVSLADERDLGQIVLVNYLWPVLVVLLGGLLTDDRPRRVPMLLAVVLGFAGVAMCRGPETFTRPAGNLLPHGLAFAGALAWSVYSVLLRRWRVPDESCGSTPAFLSCSLLAAAIGLADGSFERMQLPPANALVWIVVYGVGTVGLGYPLWELGMKRGSVHLVAVAAYIIPPVSAALMAVLFSEAASGWLIPGALLITAGAVVAARSGGPR